MRYDFSGTRSSPNSIEVTLVKCFVIMPISMPEIWAEMYNDPKHFAHVYEYLFFPALKDAGYEAIPPVTVGAELIHAQIISNLEASDMVLCDISTLNPNVFFELGIRTSLNRPVIIVRDNFTLHIPFDTASINTYKYDASLQPWKLPSQVEALTEHIRIAADSSGDQNSLWRYFGLTQRAAPAEITDPVEAKLDLLIAEVSRLAKTSGTSPDASTGASTATERAFQYEAAVHEAINMMGYTSSRNSVTGFNAMNRGFDMLVRDKNGHEVGAELVSTNKPVSQYRYHRTADFAAHSDIPIVLITNGLLMPSITESPLVGQLEVVHWRDHNDSEQLAEVLGRMFASISGGSDAQTEG